MKTSDTHISPSCPSRDARLRDIGDSMFYFVTNALGQTDPMPWHAWDVRVQASNFNFSRKLRPDHIDDIDLELAISILRDNGWSVQLAK